MTRLVIPALCSLLCLPAPALAAVVDDAPEAADYTLVYELEIPDATGAWLTPVPYTVDDTANFVGAFDRVAYHLELQRPGEDRVFVYVSMPTPVMNLGQVGVPHFNTGVVLQQLVEDMHVVSNHPSLAGLSTVDTGAIEFWPSNYAPNNAGGVPNASHDVYDFGDAPASGAGYGSMQIHDYASGQTLFSYSAWGLVDATCDLGIGNNPATDGHPDWTFSQGGPTYTLKTLRVLVRPGTTPTGLSLVVASPDPHQVVQRQPNGMGTVPVAGDLKIPCDRIEARVIPIDLSGADAGDPLPWTLVQDAPAGANFFGLIDVPTGWYRMEVQALDETDAVLDVVHVSPVGVGEVFITAGQSNSANSGDPPLTPADPRVSAWGLGGWQHAVDPQPIATGTGGTPWPPLGDLLAERFGVPIGFLSVGWGGTSVSQWRPYAVDDLFSRLVLVLDEVGLHGARAILWHQGESDAAGNVSAEDYATQLTEVIEASRYEAGWPIPWGVARAGFLPGLEAIAYETIVQGQQAVIDADPLVFAGPFTDDLIGEAWRWDTVHFNEVGLIEHAARWDAAIILPLCDGPEICNGIDDDCDGETDEESCHDGFPCTEDICDPDEGCVYPPNTSLCDDQNACTDGDACADGVCKGNIGVDCDDDDLCTTDSCDPTTGCTHVPNTAPCDDQNVCTVGDSCLDGSCTAGGAPLPCDDNRDCTDDTCDPVMGCVFTPREDACDPPDTPQPDTPQPGDPSDTVDGVEDAEAPDASGPDITGTGEDLGVNTPTGEVPPDTDDPGVVSSGCHAGQASQGTSAPLWMLALATLWFLRRRSLTPLTDPRSLARGDRGR